MRKNCILFILLGVFALFPVELSAQEGPPEIPDGPPHLSPQFRPFTVSFDEDTGDLTICFRRAIADATLFIYKDGCLVEEEDFTDITAGTTAIYDLSLYGNGFFAVYIRIEESLYAVFEEEIEELTNY